MCICVPAPAAAGKIGCAMTLHTPGDPDNPEWTLKYTWKGFGYTLYFQGETVEYPNLDAMKAAIEEEEDA